MSVPDKVFLVGPMGAGKTTIGRLLAQSLKLDFVDSDLEIEARAGADIPWIFDVEGEEGFREREARAIAELTERSGIVLATGGGAVLRAENRELLASRGVVVYLYASLERQVQRTARDRNRPLLQVEDPAARLAELMAQRDPLYREIAAHVMETDGEPPRQVVSRLVQLLKQD
ncbi:MAG: shikimate kinase AroK [Halieaceae bacterium]|jgi:shikimate kinase|nr:shikimate kinase AroK [Halieaceae bacterium]